MTSISTKTGDYGQTSLANGERVAKDSLVMEVIGSLDELNSWMGVVIAQLEGDSLGQRHTLESVQQDLYTLSAVIVRAPKVEFKKKNLRELEKQADLLEREMAGVWQGKFLHPGGTKLAAWLDIARTVCRRCERLYFKYSRNDGDKDIIAAYLNRLSDYIYLVRCFINLHQNYEEKTLSIDK